MHPTRIFKKPDELWSAFQAYKKENHEKSKEWLDVKYVGKDGNRVTDPYKLPLTYEGFKRYCFEHYGDVKNYFENSGNLYNDFKDICSRVKNEIRENQIIGGMLGVFNPSITQRLNGLTEKTDTTVRTEQPLLPDA